MEFWGVEVKAGEPLKVQPDFESLIHVSQAALGESKKDKSNESVHLFLNIDGKKMVLGTLNGQNIPQLSFDLVFEKEFELSHNWKNGSVFVCGYQTPLPDDAPTDFDDEGDSEEEDELIPLGGAGNGEAKPGNAKPVAAKANAGKPEAAKPKAKAADPKKDNKSEDGSDDDSDEEDDSDDSDESGEGSEEGMSVDVESEDDEDSEDEETPKKAEPSKKRSNDSATKTPVSTKKQKTTTPQKTDGKKPAPHTATPHPAKQGGKAAANGNKSQSPKSGGQFSCASCKKAFGSEVGLQSHNKAKHAAK